MLPPQSVNRLLPMGTDRQQFSYLGSLDLARLGRCVRFTAAGTPLAVRYDGRIWGVIENLPTRSPETHSGALTAADPRFTPGPLSGQWLLEASLATEPSPAKHRAMDLTVGLPQRLIQPLKVVLACAVNSMPQETEMPGAFSFEPRLWSWQGKERAGYSVGPGRPLLAFTL